ncbi:MAG: hypothetical protein ACRDN0_36885, partial [Trebonia sp.]
MIHIRYETISSGLNGKAESAARGTTIYLVPGLSWQQRKAALRRLRQEASRGCGPALPAGQLVLAVAVDRVRMGVRQALAVVRLHPRAAWSRLSRLAGASRFSCWRRSPSGSS